MKVCSYILLNINIDGKEKLDKLLKKLTEGSAYYTQEHIPSMQLLLSQMLVLNHMEQLDQTTASRILPKLIEEMDRRSLDQTLTFKNNKAICKKYLFPNLERDVENIIFHKFFDDKKETKEKEETLVKPEEAHSKVEAVQIPQDKKRPRAKRLRRLAKKQIKNNESDIPVKLAEPIKSIKPAF